MIFAWNGGIAGKVARSTRLTEARVSEHAGTTVSA